MGDYDLLWGKLTMQEIDMNTRILMTTSSLLLALAGIFALFAPDVLLAILSVPMANPLSVLIQLMGHCIFPWL